MRGADVRYDVCVEPGGVSDGLRALYFCHRAGTRRSTPAPAAGGGGVNARGTYIYCTWEGFRS